jgi:hypothetical protein
MSGYACVHPHPHQLANLADDASTRASLHATPTSRSARSADLQIRARVDKITSAPTFFLVLQYAWRTRIPELCPPLQFSVQICVFPVLS